MNRRKAEIPVKGLFNEKECLWFLNRDFDDCMYKVYPDKVRRAFKYDHEIMLVDIYPMPDKLVIEYLTDPPSNEAFSFVVRFVTDWFDMDSDLAAFYKLIVADKRLAYMAEEFEGLRFIGMPDLFEAMAWCIIGQQINLSFAYKVKRRLVEQYGESINYEGQKYYLFPSPEVLAKASVINLRELQFSVKKAEYLIAIAQAFTGGKVSKDILLELPDFESRIKFLTGIRGIGQWTANYVLMKSLKEPSCIPHGDAGLLNALINHRIIKSKDDKRSIDKFFKSFDGWESYLVFYLWRTLAKPKEEL